MDVLAAFTLSSTFGQVVPDACFSDRKEDIREFRFSSRLRRERGGCETGGRSRNGQNGVIVFSLVAFVGQ
jgi:hypothetical protein